MQKSARCIRHRPVLVIEKPPIVDSISSLLLVQLKYHLYCNVMCSLYTKYYFYQTLS